MEQKPQSPQHRPAGIPPTMRHRMAPPRPIAPAQAAPPPPPPKPMPAKSKKSITFAAVSLGIVGVLIIIAASIMGIQKLMLMTSIKSGYQAVFLNNNMVYFGRVSNITEEYIKISDVYYLQVQQQAGQTGTTQTNNSSTQQPQLSLTKLGNELHGPEDTMYINRKEVLFWENLKDDGKVVQAIKGYQKK